MKEMAQAPPCTPCTLRSKSPFSTGFSTDLLSSEHMSYFLFKPRFPYSWDSMVLNTRICLVEKEWGGYKSKESASLQRGDKAEKGKWPTATCLCLPGREEGEAG